MTGVPLLQNAYCEVFTLAILHLYPINDCNKMPIFVFNIIYKLLLTSWTGIFLFNIMLKVVDTVTFTSITQARHYSNAITQFITQFITQMPLLKSLLIITQMPFSLLTITPPLLKGHRASGFADSDVGVKYESISKFEDPEAPSHAFKARQVFLP